MAKHVIQSPDGRIWAISVSRFRRRGPVGLARGLVSHRRWVRASCADVTATWKADRRDARLVADELADLLTQGYEWESPAGAEFVGRSEPPPEGSSSGA
jgi:hypothetical protein